jgi:hypothetical protein
MQVSLLRMNTTITRAVETQSTLVRENANLEATLATKMSGDKVRAAAIKDAMVDPPAGDTRFLVARPGTDPWLAARRMKPPSEAARAVMQNGGRLPGVTATGAADTLAAGTSGTGATQTVPGTTTATAASAAQATTATATPTPTPVSSVPTPTATPTVPTPTATPTLAVTAVATAPQG